MSFPRLPRTICRVHLDFFLRHGPPSVLHSPATPLPRSPAGRQHRQLPALPAPLSLFPPPCSPFGAASSAPYIGTAACKAHQCRCCERFIYNACASGGQKCPVGHMQMALAVGAARCVACVHWQGRGRSAGRSTQGVKRSGGGVSTCGSQGDRPPVCDGARIVIQ